MSIFKEVGITWAGEEYLIRADKVMGLVEVVEDIITMEELNSKGIKRAKISRAFCAALSYAGKRVPVEDVYNKFFDDSAGVELTSIINFILMLMIPPEHLQGDAVEEEPKKEEAPQENAS